MNYKLVFISLVALFLQSCHIDFLDCYDGDFVDRELVLDEINAIEIDFPCEIVLVDGTSQSIKVNAKEDLIEDLEDKSTVSGKTWKVRLKNNCIKHREDITLTLTIPGLRRLEVDGSVKVAGNGHMTMLNEDFNLDFDGDADVILDEVTLRKLTIRADGDMDFSLSGYAETVSYDMDGSGKLAAHDLQSGFVALNMDGHLLAELWVTEKLNATLNGKATVCLKGNPSVVSQINGSGKIQNCN